MSLLRHGYITAPILGALWVVGLPALWPDHCLLRPLRVRLRVASRQATICQIPLGIQRPLPAGWFIHVPRRER